MIFIIIIVHNQTFYLKHFIHCLSGVSLTDLNFEVWTEMLSPLLLLLSSVAWGIILKSIGKFWLRWRCMNEAGSASFTEGWLSLDIIFWIRFGASRC